VRLRTLGTVATAAGGAPGPAGVGRFLTLDVEVEADAAVVGLAGRF
jgi:hypothetical protein